MKSNKEIKKEMKRIMSISRGQLIAMSLMTIVSGGISLFLFLFTQFSSLSVSLGLRAGLWGEATNVIKWVYLGLIIYLVISIVIGSCVELGYNRAMLLRTKEMPIQKGTLFYYFSMWFNALLLRAFSAVKVTLWSLLLLVPGIFAMFNYLLAPYLLAQHPKMSPNDAIKVIIYLMKGYRWRFFLLMLSFIDEIVISVLALGIPFIYVIPRMKAAAAIFYRERVAVHDEEVRYIQTHMAKEV